MSVDEVLPQFHHRERHAVRVDAPAHRALAAARAVTPTEARALGFLFWLRGLGGSLDRPVWERLEAAGFREVARDTLAADGRPWQLLSGLGAGEGSFAKMALDFRVVDGRLTTETRVWLTDARARRRFRAYWLVVRPLSGLVRRSWLRAAKKLAERAE